MRLDRSGRWLLAGLALAAAAATWAVVARGGARATPESGPPAGDVGPAEVGAAPDPERAPVDGPGTLHLTVLDRAGERVPGRVLWTTSPSPPLTSSVLAPDLGYAPLPAHARQDEHGGAVRLEVPPGHWTWLRVTAGTRPPAAAYLRLPPFRGTARREVRLDPAVKAIHAFVLAADLREPAAGAEVRLLATPLQDGGEPQPVATRRADGHGYAVFSGLPAGAYLVCAEGASPGDGPPSTARVLLLDRMPAHETPCTLVLPEPRGTLRLRVWAELPASRGPAPKLFLRRLGAPEGGLQPMPGVLRPGHQEVELRVPLGEYALDVLPLGVLRIVPERPRYAVAAEPDPPVLDLRLQPEPVETEVALVGLERRDLPVSVRPRPVGGLRTEEEHLLFCGPYRWHRPTQSVRAPAAPARLVVSTRRAFWLSEHEVLLRGGRMEVSLRPATRLEVRCYTDARRTGARLLVDVRDATGTETLLLAERLLDEGGALRVGFGGAIVVARGAVALRGWDPDDGATLWTREVQVDSARHRVTVEE